MNTGFTAEDITIRTVLRAGDMGYITYLHGRLYDEEYQYGMAHEHYVAQGLAEFYEQYDPQLDKVWIAEYNGRIIGSLVLKHRGKAAQLRYFIIEPAFRGIGLGKRLMGLFMEAIQTGGYASSYLLTIHELTAAASLYTRAGFRVTEEKESSALGRPLLEQRYDLTLP